MTRLKQYTEFNLTANSVAVWKTPILYVSRHFGKTVQNCHLNSNKQICVNALITNYSPMSFFCFVIDSLALKLVNWRINDKNIIYTTIKLLKFIYSEKATKFCKTFRWQYIGQIIGGNFAKFCGLLRIYELYSIQNSNDIY